MSSSYTMNRLLRFATGIGLVFGITGCNTVSDLVVTHLPNWQRGKVSIIVQLSKQEAHLYRGGAEVAEARISTGREGHGTPIGQFTVIRKDADHCSSLYGSYVDDSGTVVTHFVDVRKTAKPSNTHLVGASMPFFLEFSPGYGLHAGYLPGYPASHGCVRMPYWKARQFFDAAKIGTPVTIER